MASERIHSIVAKIRKPLDFASRNGYANIRSLVGMEPLISTLVEELRSFGGTTGACDELLSAFQGFDSLLEPAKKARIVRADAVLSELEREGGQADAAPGDRGGVMTRAEGTGPVLALDTSVQYCKGVGPRRAELLTKLGIGTVDDALSYLPWRYEDRGNLKKLSQLSYGAFETVSGAVVAAEVVQTKRQRVKVFELVITDQTGVLVGSWFNQPFMQKTFKVGQRVVLSGIVKTNPYRGGRAQMDNPDFEVLDEVEGDSLLIHTGRIVPIYRTTAGLSPRTLRAIMWGIVDSCASLMPEALPGEIVQRYGLMPAREALAEVHFPEQEKDIAALNQGRSNGHRRLIFEELFVLETGLALRKRGVTGEKKGVAFVACGL